jgi:MYXO-CTERM domain-containing protein
VVDPATGEIGFEVEAVGGASFDGRALYFERAGRPPEGGNELVRWTPAEGVQRLRTVELRTWVAAGHEGRPLLVRHGEAPRFLQLDARDAFQPVAPELDPEATCGWQVGERALWWMICDEDAWTLWSAPFEAGEPSIVGTSWPGSGSRPDLSWQVREGLVELYGAPFVPVGDRLELIDGLRVADGSARGPYGGRLEVARLGERRLLAATDTPRWRDDGPAFEATPPFASVPDWVGRELWVLDPVGNAGAAPTPRLVKDLFPGAQGSDPRALTAVPGSDRIVFHARTPDAGRELWVSDGTPDGTRPLCDLGAGRAPGVPEAATIRIGPDALFVTAFVPDVGTEVVAVPLAVVKGDAPCRGFEGAAPDLLTEADAGCGCRSTSGSTSPETLLLGVLLVAWLVRRAGRVRAARL